MIKKSLINQPNSNSSDIQETQHFDILIQNRRLVKKIEIMERMIIRQSKKISQLETNYKILLEKINDKKIDPSTY